jgi:hypothetical protein
MHVDEMPCAISCKTCSFPSPPTWAFHVACSTCTPRIVTTYINTSYLLLRVSKMRDGMGVCVWVAQGRHMTQDCMVSHFNILCCGMHAKCVHAARPLCSTSRCYTLAMPKVYASIANALLHLPQPPWRRATCLGCVHPSRD